MYSTPTLPQEIISLHPGAIDNSSLQHPRYPTELRRGLVEGADLVLLPYDLASSFFKKYGGSMTLNRGTLNIGTMYMPKVQINLYPIRVEGYCCNAAYPQPAKSQYYMAYYNKTQVCTFYTSHYTYTIHHTPFSSSQTFSDILRDLCTRLSVYPNSSSVRYW
ncbi:hypothetical protein EON63_15960, partial [archaeon]